MIAFLRWILSLFITVVVLVFALANREIIAIVWSPFHTPAPLPLFVPVLGALAFGFISGGAMVWLNAASQRQERRRQRKIIEKLERNLEEHYEERDHFVAAKDARDTATALPTAPSAAQPSSPATGASPITSPSLATSQAYTHDR